MSPTTNAEIAHALLVSCRLPGYDPSRDSAPTYPAVEDDSFTTTNALLAALTHAVLALGDAKSPPNPARDVHSFGPDDPPITMPRKLATELLERMEMARDRIERTTKRKDTWARRIIFQLEELLS